MTGYPTALSTTTATLRTARLLGCALALLGWAHLAGPVGPELRESLFGRNAPASQTSLASVDERLRRERRLRRELSYRGLRLIRRRSRDPAPAPGGYMVFDLTAGRIVIGGDPAPFASDLDAVEAWFADHLAKLAMAAGAPAPEPFGTRQRDGEARSKMAPHQAALAEHMATRPAATLAELQAWMLEERGVAVSIATVCKTLQRLGLSPKHGRAR